MFVCSLPDDTKENNPKSISKVLLRLYGAFYSDMSESTVRMMEECIICGLLAEKNMGPDLYGIFPEGRLEQFIPDVSFSLIALFIYSYWRLAVALGSVNTVSDPLVTTSSFAVMERR